MIQKIPDSLHLGQNQPALWSLDILRHYQKHTIPLRHQMSRDALLLVILGQKPDQLLTNLVDAFPGFGADQYGGKAVIPFQGVRIGLGVL